MDAIKRLEIITDAHEMREVCAVLDALGVSGYSVLHNVTGRGERGVQSGDELTGVFTNELLITTCEPQRLAELVEAIRPILRKRGGVCLVTDALSVRH
jgi:nitrogen regulatory protein PII